MASVLAGILFHLGLLVTCLPWSSLGSRAPRSPGALVKMKAFWLGILFLHGLDCWGLETCLLLPPCLSLLSAHCTGSPSMFWKDFLVGNTIVRMMTTHPAPSSLVLYFCFQVETGQSRSTFYPFPLIFQAPKARRLSHKPLSTCHVERRPSVAQEFCLVSVRATWPPTGQILRMGSLLRLPLTL